MKLVLLPHNMACAECGRVPLMSVEGSDGQKFWQPGKRVEVRCSNRECKDHGKVGFFTPETIELQDA